MRGLFLRPLDLQQLHNLLAQSGEGQAAVERTRPIGGVVKALEGNLRVQGDQTLLPEGQQGVADRLPLSGAVQTDGVLPPAVEAGGKKGSDGQLLQDFQL